MPGARLPARTCPDRKRGSGRPARLLSVSDLTPSPYFLHGDGFGVARVWVTGQGSDAQGLRRRTWGVGDERPADVREPGGGCLPAGVSPGAFARDPRGPTQEARHTQSLGPPFRTAISGSKRHSQPRRSIKRQRLHHSPVLAATPAHAPTADPARRRLAAAQAH